MKQQFPAGCRTSPPTAATGSTLGEAARLLRMATVAVVYLRLNVVQAMSLKDKRRVLKSFKTRLSNTWNVSVAEVDDLESHRMATVAIAMVSNDSRYVESTLQKIVNKAANHRDMILLDHEVQWL
ncbi:MAG: DUF503 domain-containing protein [Planctomycetota bacterium]